MNSLNKNTKISFPSLLKTIKGQDHNNFSSMQAIFHLQASARSFAKNSKFVDAQKLYILLVKLVTEVYGRNS